MPLANPNRSFDVAARHLFRHLHDPVRLRRNPLVRRLFVDENGRATRKLEQAALASIMRCLEQGVAEVCSADLDANDHEQVYRQREIVRRTYFERTAIEDVAFALGLSIRQYYRERERVTMRLARYIETARERAFIPATFTCLDPLRFQMEQASHRMDMGDGAGAASAYVDVLDATDAARTRIEALCRLSEVLSETGDDAAAAIRLRDAEISLAADAYELTMVAREAARCHISLVRSCLAWRQGDIEAADDALASASGQVESLVVEGGVRVRDLCVDVLLERARRLGDRGLFAAAVGEITRADQIHAKGGDAPLRQRSDAVRLRAVLGMTAAEPLTTATEAVALISEALFLARQCGSATRIVLANAASAVLHRYSGETAGARDAVFRSVSMMHRIALPRFQASIAAIAADALFQTAHWRRGVPLLAGASGIHSVGSGEWLKLQQIRAEYALHLGRWSESYGLAATCEASARVIGSPRYRGAGLRCMALSAHFLGRSDEARECVAAAVQEVERNGSALSRAYTARVVTMIASAPR